ncbi:MAG: FCSD flavin-binding domain-containing protein [Devosia sp.]
MNGFTRRQAIALSSAFAGGLLAAPALASGTAKVVVVGGGFGGVAAARELRAIDPAIEVTLVVEGDSYSTCPFSNLVIAGQRPMSAITFGYDSLAAQGVIIRQGLAERIDAQRRVVVLTGGDELPFDRAIVSPGIALKFDAVPGYDEAAAEIMPHAWKAGPQTELLRDKLAAMRQGGTFLMAVPDNPYRCPPGPYERASLVAWYLSRNNPTAKIIIVDGKDSFSKQSLFEQAWAERYPDMIRHVPFAESGGVLEVNPDTLEVHTPFESFQGDVVNFIPPQRAAAVASASGLTGSGEWCQIDQATFESDVAPGVHVLGDAAIVGDMPKSGFSASVQGSVCAHVVAALLRNAAPPQGVLLNTCYSLIAPDYGISVAGVYRVNGEGLLKSVDGSGGNSPLEVPDGFRQAEADYAMSWYETLTGRLFG